MLDGISTGDIIVICVGAVICRHLGKYARLSTIVIAGILLTIVGGTIMKYV